MISWRRLIQIFLIFLGLAFPAIGWYAGSHFLPNTFIGNLDVGNKTYTQVQQMIAGVRFTQKWCFQTEGKLGTCYPATKVGFSFRPEETLAYSWQHRWHWPGKITVFPFQYRLNWQEWQARLATIAAQLKKPAIPPSLDLVASRVVVHAGQQGQEIDWQKLRRQVNKDCQRGKIPIFWRIPQRHWGDYYSKSQRRQAKEWAEKIKTKTLVFRSEKEKFVITGPQLLNFIGFQSPWRKDKIKAYLQGLAGTLDKPPENALFQFQKGRVVVFRPAKVGRHLKVTKVETNVENCLWQLVKGQKTCSVVLQFKKQPPAIATAASNRLGIRELIASGDSYFWGSSANRIHNLTLASQKLNGLLIAPGEVFSLNKAVGEISAATGFRPAYIIKEGKTILGDGGGVCQVSTTLFRAALNAGLPILERHAHAYRVHYYEENAPLGLDATVFAPSADLRFQNDYSHYLLLQTKIDIPHRHLVFQFYGTGDSRQVKISPPRTWDWQPAPPPRYIDDPNLPPGVTRQIDWAAAGIKVAVDWQVWRDGKLLHQQTFYSNYQPWQAIYRRGK